MYNEMKKFYYFFKYQFLKIRYNNIIKEVDKLKIMDDDQTINEIIVNKKSISRYGDGEFRWILQTDDVPSFQENNDELTKDLIRVLNEQNDDLIIGLPRNFIYRKKMKISSNLFWLNFLITYWNKIKNNLSYNKIYANTNLTRFYMDYKDKSECGHKVEQLKKIWDEKKVLIVEGNKTRLGVGNDLLHNAKSIKRILCPSNNSYSKIKDIENSIVKIKNNYDFDILLIALGPTATVIASDLSKKGIQCIDIGHIDVEYEWFRRNAKNKIKIKGKYVNEAGNKKDDIIDDVNDVQYNESIMLRLD